MRSLKTAPAYAPPEVSIVVCVYNEAGNGKPLAAQIRQAMQDVRYELIYVNDGSTDETLSELRAINDSNLIILDLQRNYGQSFALAAGIEQARGTYIVTLDGDQQNDPADIMPLVRYCHGNDLDVVAGLRANRQDDFLLRKVPSLVANRLIRWATGTRLHDLGCGLKVFRADVAKQLNLYGELHRFVLILAHLDGARMAQLPVNHRPRQIGQSKYGLGRVLRVVSDLILLLFLKKYLRRPMHLFGTAGLLLIGAGIASILVILTGNVTGADSRFGLTLTVGLVLLIGGLQSLTAGIMAELQLRTLL